MVPSLATNLAPAGRIPEPERLPERVWNHRAFARFSPNTEVAAPLSAAENEAPFDERGTMTIPSETPRGDATRREFRLLPGLGEARLRWHDPETGVPLHVTAHVSREFLEELGTLGFQGLDRGLGDAALEGRREEESGAV